MGAGSYGKTGMDVKVRNYPHGDSLHLFSGKIKANTVHTDPPVVPGD
jgi:hypothetical protein